MDSVYKLFLDPPNEFSQLPWWFWNDDITENGIIHQLSEFKKPRYLWFYNSSKNGTSAYYTISW